jgi:hypothetical protein
VLCMMVLSVSSITRLRVETETWRACYISDQIRRCRWRPEILTATVSVYAAIDLLRADLAAGCDQHHGRVDDLARFFGDRDEDTSITRPAR